MKKFTEDELECLGQVIGRILNIPYTQESNTKHDYVYDRIMFKTKWGHKNGLGLLRMLDRLFLDIEKDNTKVWEYYK